MTRTAGSDVAGVRFHTAIICFLVVLAAGPVLLGADLLQAALNSERKKIEREFFLTMERSISAKKQRLVELAGAPYRSLDAFASDAALLRGDPQRFAEAAASLTGRPFVHGVYLLAPDGAVLRATGSAGLEGMQVLVRSALDRTMVMSSDGMGIKVASGAAAPFLCVVFDIQMSMMRLTNQWAAEMASDTVDRLLLALQSHDSGAWKFVVVGAGRIGASGAAQVASLPLPAGFALADPQNRTQIIETASGTRGCLIDAAAGGGFNVMLRDAAPVAIAYREFLWVTGLKLFASLLYILVGGLLLASSLSRPVQRLAAVCDEVRAGRYDVAPPPSFFSEFNHLGETLQQMALRVGGQLNQANERLVAEHRRLSALFASVQDAVYLLDRDGHLTMANPVARTRLGLPDPLPDQGVPLDDRRRSLLAGFPPERESHVVQHQEPADRARYQIVATRLRDSAGLDFGLVVVERDITLEHEVDRMKSEFVSNVSHELRTPLTSIQAYTEMLVDGDVHDPEQQKEYLTIVLAETERLNRLVNDVLDLSRIESGRQIVRKKQLDAVEVAARAARIVEQWALRKKHLFETDLDPQTGSVFADPDMLEQALLNLLSNAVKYTPDGGRIWLTCRREGDAVTFAVRDTGLGMTDRDRARLFTKFFRADNEVVRQAGGTGLGLVLVGEIARLHEGKVVVDSVLGAGSTFSLVIPTGVSGAAST